MFKEKMKELRKLIADKEALTASMGSELRSLLEAEKLDEAKAKSAERAAINAELVELRETLALYEEQLEGESKPTDRSVAKPKSNEQRDALNAFIRSKGRLTEGVELVGKDEAVVPEHLWRSIEPTTQGVVTEDTKLVTSSEVYYTPEREIKTVVNLKLFARIHKATKGSGKYPVLKRATDRMYSVAELEANPALSKPEFTSVSWDIVTYRGAIPLSQESIDDADVDLVAIVAEHNDEISINTSNFAVSEVMKTFTSKPVETLDDIKKIYNVDLDPAYNKAFFASQSFYNFLDTVKDDNGRYMLKDDISSASGKSFGGYPIFVIGDEALGVKGEAKCFLGDVKRGVLFADRKQLTVRWVEHELYGQYLQAVLRFDVKKADSNAGYLLTYTPPVTP
ncbi:phage major capsid protein [Jeotgalibaca porci]|uniref:phage major capsid protein n=1 Tax=Jeotgalibaca porci TaxID=1868793 RepID=UPI0035A116A2